MFGTGLSRVRWIFPNNCAIDAVSGGNLLLHRGKKYEVELIGTKTNALLEKDDQDGILFVTEKELVKLLKQVKNL